MILQPLHLAVEADAVKAVELLLTRSHVANTIRDSEGSLPLHVAVRRGLPHIVKILIDASPSTLFMEDGVGSTVSESVALNRFRERMNQFIGNNYSRVGNVYRGTISKFPERFDLAHLEKELPRLRDTINSLLKVGKLRKDTKLEKELVRFADKMEEHMRSLQPVVVGPAKELENPVDVQDHDATCDVVRKALDHVQGQRQLVHLLDVQKSVDGILESIYRPTKQDNVDRDMATEEKETETKFVEGHAFQ